MTRFYSLKEIREQRLLPHSMTSLRRLVKDGELNAVNKGSGLKRKRYAVSSEEIQRFISTLK